MDRKSDASRLNFYSIFAVILCCVALCRAYTGLIPADKENPGKCFFRGDHLKAGETINTAPCQKLTCNEDGSISIEGCGKLRLPNCNKGERINGDKPYPECCVLKYKCKQEDGTPFYIEKDVSSNDKSNKAENST